MKCKYTYKSKEGTTHEFKNEIELDDFLLSRYKFEDEFGDLVFSLKGEALAARERAKKIAKLTAELKKKVEKVDYIEGIEVERFKKPFTGVTAYLNEFIDSSGKPLFPIFTPEEYWKRRVIYWKTGDLNVEYDAKTATGAFTKEERELIFGDEPPKRLSETEIETWIKIITQKWKLQGVLGEDIHHIMEMFFRKYEGAYNFEKFRNNKQGFIDMIKKYTEGADRLNDEIIGKVYDYGYVILNKIKQTIPNSDKLDFYPELKISGDLAEPRKDGVKSLVGSIDLLVIDGEGNSYVFDYKTSPKPYSEYDTAKIRTFMYQLAVYNRLLQRFGFKDYQNKLFILPIKFDNYRLSNKEQAILDSSKAVFVYDNISWDNDDLIRDLTPSIKADDSLNAHLDSFLPRVKIQDVDTDKLVERVTTDMDELFGGLIKKKSYTDDDIKKLIDDIKPDENGNLTFVLKGGYNSKPIVAKSKPELHAKVKELFLKFETSDMRRVGIIADAISKARTTGVNSIEALEEVIDLLGTKKLFDETGDLNFLKNQLQPYFEDESWEVIRDEGASQFGCLILKNKFTKLLDVIKISGRNLDYKLFYERNTRSGKTTKDSRRGNLTFNFETDIVEKLDKNSGMLEASMGNVESMEVLLILNLKMSYFEDGTKIGNIQVINPFIGQGSKAPNWQLEYSYKKLRKLKKLNDGIDNIDKGDIKFMDLLDLVELDFRTELNKLDTKESFGKDTQKFLSALTVLDSATDNQSKLDAVEKMIELVRKKYPQDTVQLQNNNASKGARLYNRLLLAAAELRGIKFKLQIERTDKWPIFNISKAIKNGLSSSYIDNPGNLDSETLNLLTLLVTEGYQNVRNDMADHVSKVRKLTDALKKSKGFGALSQNVIGNPTSIYKSMFREVKGDLVLKNINDLKTKEEKEFAKYFLRQVNRNRFPGMSELELDEMEQNDDIEYYRVPLAKGSFGSDVAMRGLFSSLKSRLKNWTPKNALRELRAKAEGYFTDEEVNSIDKSDSELFEMNNKFARCDTDEEYRLEEAIGKKGVDYFEHNLETLLLEHTFAYTTKKHLDRVFPMIRAAMVHLKVMGENEQNRQFSSDLEYAKNYIKAMIKNLQIDENLKEMELKALSLKLKQAASYMALAFSPVQALYQSIQGFWVDISLIIRKPDGTQAFTFANFSKAFRIVYGDLFPHKEPSKVLLLNELYAVNDMDMNTYTKNIKSDQGGIFNVYDLAFKFASRPDYYNRMTILVAQMLEDGTWDAYKVVDGKLVYDPKLDKRFEHFRLGQKTHPKYDYEKSLYFAIAEQHIKEGSVNPDGSDFKLNGDEYVDLPAAHTILEIESFKSLGDLIYGYYAHEKKSLIHYHFLGSLFMQMRTYWSGKKNQYLAPGGVRVMGRWELVKNNEGKPLYYQVIDGKIRTDLPFVDENTGAPVVLWKGNWQEGIMVTLSTLAQGTFDYMNTNDSLDIFAAYKDAVQSKYSNSEELQRAYVNNMKQLGYDLTIYFLIGSIISGTLLANWSKDLIKDAKEREDLISGLQASAANILVASVKNSAADFAFWDSILNPASQWTPFSFETGIRTFKNVWNTAFGDRTFWGGVTNTFAVTKQFKPLMLNIAPLKEEKE